MESRKPCMQHEDMYKRINFLYQAAYKCLETSPGDLSLCRYYVYTLRTITKRLTLHMHPELKRSVCRRCCVLLIPGVTAMVRHRHKRQRHAVVTCLECGTFKRYVTIPDKMPWIDRDENWENIVINGVSVQTPQSLQQSRKKNKGNQAKNQSKQQDGSQAISAENSSGTSSVNNSDRYSNNEDIPNT